MKTDLVRAWQSSASIDEVIEKLAWTGTRRSLIVTASQLRARGVDLKKFKDRVSVEALQAAAAESLDPDTLKDQFIRIWQTSVSVSEVAERLALSYASVTAKAHTLRKQGIVLKRFRRSKQS
jgi:DNA-binding transcriptional ArsR family regulator